MASLRAGTRWFCRIVLTAVLTMILGAIVVLVAIPRATHGAALDVLTGSMSPHIPVGSVVIERPVDPGTLHVGDVATYQAVPGKAQYITHRIVKIDTSKTPVEFTFKGDANRGPDIKPVPATAIRGKVWFHVPYLGGIRDAIQTKGGVAGIAMVLLAGYALFQVASVYRDKRARRTSEVASSPNPTASLEMGVDPVSSESTRLAGSASLNGDLIRRRLQLLSGLPAEAFNSLGPQDLLGLMGGVLLDADDATFNQRLIAERLTAHVDGPSLTAAVSERAPEPEDAQPPSVAKSDPVDDFDVEDVRRATTHELDQIRRLRQKRQRVHV